MCFPLGRLTQLPWSTSRRPDAGCNFQWLFHSTLDSRLYLDWKG
ncbi:MAG: hypothetical protein QOH24_206, partial [Verrucomicrobiota bacterium]